jgi:hypothetical protein
MHQSIVTCISDISLLLLLLFMLLLLLLAGAAAAAAVRVASPRSCTRV